MRGAPLGNVLRRLQNPDHLIDPDKYLMGGEGWIVVEKAPLVSENHSHALVLVNGKCLWDQRRRDWARWRGIP